MLERILDDRVNYPADVSSVIKENTSTTIISRPYELSRVMDSSIIYIGKGKLNCKRAILVEAS